MDDDDGISVLCVFVFVCVTVGKSVRRVMYISLPLPLSYIFRFLSTELFRVSCILFRASL